MLEVLRRIVQEVNTARDLDQVLDIVVTKIKLSMAVDAASVFLVDSEHNQLVLKKTDGLNREAVNSARIPIDQGLVGYVVSTAETLNIANAKKDQRYLRYPSVGEEDYNAFLGVPVIYQRKVLGVLVAQRVEKRRFREENVAFMIALSSQLAGAIAHWRLRTETDISNDPDRGKEKCFSCVPGAPGVAIGTAYVIYSSSDFDAVPDRQVKNVEAEIKIFKKAVESVCADLKAMRERLVDVLSDEDHALFDAYILLARSDTLVNGTIRRIRAGNWAQAALRDTVQEQIMRFTDLHDEYMRERADDIREIGLRIFRKLHSDDSAPIKYPKRTILVGEEIGATQLADVPAKRIAGVISAKGSNSSHVAILARAMGIPAVMGASNISLGWMDQCEVIADGYQGRIYVQPPPVIKMEYSRMIKEESKLKKELRGMRQLPTETRDGVPMTLLINSGILADEASQKADDGDGVGLYRTEFLFMLRESFPSEQDQRTLYANILKAYAPRPVTIRTLDVGSDKPLPYFPVAEDNPALGWRGIRVALDHPDLFVTQVKAMLKASEGLENLQIMFPMFSNLDELDEVQALYEHALYEVRQEGFDIVTPKVGAMIEVPSAMIQAESFAKRVDFLSIGTNDLTQYLLAVDRNNARVARLYDNLNPAVLSAVKSIIDAGKRQAKPVCVCGEMAGDPMTAVLLMAMGVSSLSMSCSNIPKVKWAIRSFTFKQAQALLEQVFRQEHTHQVRSLIYNAFESVGLHNLIRIDA